MGGGEGSAPDWVPHEPEHRLLMLWRVAHLLRLEPAHAAAHRHRRVVAQGVVLQRLFLRQLPRLIGAVERARVQRLGVRVRVRGSVRVSVRVRVRVRVRVS